MSDAIAKALSSTGPHTVASLAERLPGFPEDAIRAALETLVAQGVLERGTGEGGAPTYSYIAPDRYMQADWDVIKNPGSPHNRPPR